MGKRILFYTYYECDPEKGGTERTTCILAKNLKERFGYVCFNAYKKHGEQRKIDSTFSRVYQLTGRKTGSIIRLLQECDCDIVMVQGVTTIVRPFRKAIEKTNKDIALVYAHHFAPGTFEQSFVSPGELLKDIVRHHSLKKLVMLAAYPLSKPLYLAFSRRQYKEVSELADRVVLLSETHKDSWINLGGGQENSERIRCIHNASVFEGYATQDEIQDKRKRALIVARMHEGSKRISHALKIWKQICSDPEFNEWELDVVGDGRDRESYADMAKGLNLSRIKFHGFQNPIEFYRQDSIFIMTSKFEGFGLTLLEASQNGTVPMAYDSFSVVTDLIEDKKTGCIIPDGDIHAYASQLKILMREDETRHKMAIAAVEKSKEFSADHIVEKWTNLFEEILSNTRIK